MQAQFLDQRHLLIALRTQDPEMARNMDMAPHTVFYMVYDTASSTIRKVTDKNDAGVVHAYLRHAPQFHAGDTTREWDRFVTPTVTGLQPPQEQMGLASRQWNGFLPVGELSFPVASRAERNEDIACYAFLRQCWTLPQHRLCCNCYQRFYFGSIVSAWLCMMRQV